MPRKPLNIDRYIKRKGASPNFYFIRRVPSDIERVTGKKWENRSLDTGDLPKARIYAQSLNAELEIEWTRTRLGKTLNTQAILNGFKVEAHLEASELRELPEAEAMNRALHFLERWDARKSLTDPATGLDVASVLSEKDLSNLAEKYRSTILEAIVISEKQRRMDEIHSVSTTEDFKKAFTKSKQVEIGAPYLSLVLEEFLTTKDQGDDADRVRLSVNNFISFAGDRSVNHYKRKDVLEFLERLENYPVKLKAEFLRATFAKITSGKHEKTLTHRTAKEWFNRIQKVFEFGIHKYGDDFNIQNPWRGLTSYIKGRDSIKKKPFEPEQLRAIFTHPDFVGNDQRKWVSTLCLYHGARMDEFLSRQYADFYIDSDGIFVVNISAAKNDQSNRTIPIHQTVLNYGFKEWLDARKAGGWLFPFSEFKNLAPDDHRFSKDFGRFLAGIRSITNETTFHSFRHNFASQAEAMRLSETTIKKIQGHKIGHIHGDIYVSLKPKDMKPVLDHIKFDI